MKRLFRKKAGSHEGQKRVEKALFCAIDRRETRNGPDEWLSLFEKWIVLRPCADRRSLVFKDQRVAQWQKIVEN
jgi:hypothetical protein